ncbi:Ff.00g099390.m01.CDS01 [Fusarium sp. VM40]|nr:Ff.00g099390.m01.CDS01 [Fusarium sp. VM40]
MPYKLLLYRGWKNSDLEFDDKHRFIYLAENKPGEPAAGNCFVRLEEIYKRMNANAIEYHDDCAGAILHRQVHNNLHNGGDKIMDEAYEKRNELQQQGLWLLRFRCWAVEGFQSEKHELDLWNRLFENVFTSNDQLAHFEVFTVWAELLRKSQGDKLGVKDFFGRYWDAVVPNEDRPMFKTGFMIIVGAQYFQSRNLDDQNPADCNLVRQEVCDGVGRAVNAPRLRFKPPLTEDNVVFPDWVEKNNITFTEDFDKIEWGYLFDHPGGLYTILVDLPEGYGPPQELHSRGLQVHLNKCGQAEVTRTLINNDLLSTLIKKRYPTQDKCVADAGYSANLAMSKAYPDFYPNATIAKKGRVAEWLHRSAFSYGGFINGIANSSQNANNLVLGTPHTNTVMVRYEAFVKRLATFSNNRQGTVIGNTEINYPAVTDPNGWMGKDHHRYTWLADNLHYRYYNKNDNINNINNNNNPNAPDVDRPATFNL